MAILISNDNGGIETTVTTLEAARTAAYGAGNTVKVTSALTQAQSNISGAWPTDRRLKIETGGSVNPSSAFTASGLVEMAGGVWGGTGAITFNGPFFGGSRLSTFFTGSGLVTFGPGSITGIRPEWWGARANDSTDCLAAFQKCDAAAAGQKTIRLLDGTYRISAVWRVISNIAGNSPNTSTIKNTGTGDALDLGGAGYYRLYENFTVEGNASSRDGITLCTVDGDNFAYGQFKSVYSVSNGRHGLYHRRAWGTKYLCCKFGMENKGNGGLGVLLDTIVAGEGTNNCNIFMECDSRHNGGTSVGTTVNDDKGGVKIRGSSNVSWIGGVIESNNAWGVIIQAVAGVSYCEGVYFSNLYMEATPSYATEGGLFHITGPWQNVVVENSYLAYGGTEIGQTGYGFYIERASPYTNAIFTERNNTYLIWGAGTATLYHATARSYRPPKQMISSVFGDYTNANTTSSTFIAAIKKDGVWQINGFIHFTHNADSNGTVLPFRIKYDVNASASITALVGTAILGTSTEVPTLSVTEYDAGTGTVEIALPAKCYAYITIDNSGIAVPPTTLGYSSALFPVEMRRY